MEQGSVGIDSLRVQKTSSIEADPDAKSDDRGLLQPREDRALALSQSHRQILHALAVAPLATVLGLTP